MKNKCIPANLFCMVILFFGALTEILGQESSNNKNLKLYSNFGWTIINDFDNGGNTIPTIGKTIETDIGYFSPAIAFELPKGNFHEIELSRLAVNSSAVHTAAGYKTTNFLMGFRYECAFKLFKEKDESKLESYIGFAVNPSFSNVKLRPTVSTSFPIAENRLGAIFSLVPRVNYTLNEIWFLDLNVPLNLVDVNWTFNRNENPTIEVDERTSTTSNFETLPSKFLVRLGVGLKI